MFVLLLAFTAALTAFHPSPGLGADVEAAAASTTLGPDVSATVGPPSGAPRLGTILDGELERLSATIRCPVCQSHSINDSPSESARNMKAQVRGMLAAGYDDEQIYRYLEAGYGEFIRLMPRREGWNLLVWCIPALGLVVGALAVRHTIRARRAAPPLVGGSKTGPEHASDAEPEDPYLRRVREEVDG